MADAAPDGLLLVDKPAGWTSHDVVAKARRLCRTRKVGHAGTLDPMATGVLILGVGRATKLLTFLVGADKAYTATVRLGQATITDDAEGEVINTPERGVAGVSRDEIVAAAAALTGDIQQVPSAVSAIKIDGKRAYHRVRSGEDVELPARPVTVARFDVGETRSVTLPDGTHVLDCDIQVEVSSGTYVRALARDLGAALGVGGHLTALRRTRVGGFGIERCTELDDLIALGDAGEDPPITALADAATAAFATRRLTEQEATKIGYGQRIASAVPGRVEPIAALAPDGSLVAMLDESRPTARTHVVFAPAAS